MKNTFISTWIGMWVVVAFINLHYLLKPVDIVSNSLFVLKVIGFLVTWFSFARAIYLFRAFNKTSTDNIIN